MKQQLLLCNHTFMKNSIYNFYLREFFSFFFRGNHYLSLNITKEIFFFLIFTVIFVKRTTDLVNAYLKYV